MTSNLLVTIIALVVIAALLEEPALLMPIFMLIGAPVVGRLWHGRAFRSVRVNRVMADRSFMNDTVVIKVDVVNTSRLPVVWLRLHDSAPAELGPHQFDQAISLKGLERRSFEYVVQTNRRGFFQIGPLTAQSGDVLGLSKPASKLAVHPSPLLVYPKITPLARPHIPSRMPLGGLRQRQPLLEDPSLMRGKREYVVGDSLRRVDWKAGASVGRMQVKMFESSVALETMVFLDLNAQSYDRMTRLDSIELSIVIAASVANHLVTQRQSVGLATNGVIDRRFVADARLPEGVASIQTQVSTEAARRDVPVRALPPRKGRQHLMRMLEVMAGLQVNGGEKIREVLRRECGHLAWGTTLMIITGRADDVLFDELFRARRAGLSPVLILCGPGADVVPIRGKARAFGIPVHHVRAESELRLLTFDR